MVANVIADRDNPTRVVPVIVSQQNFWLRGAMARLQDEGLRPRSIRYLEFDTFIHNGRRFLWMGDPFAEWEACHNDQVPPQIRDKFPGRVWYFVEDEDAWLGMNEPQAKRGPMPKDRHVWCSRTEAESLIAWEGGYVDPECQYWLWLP